MAAPKRTKLEREAQLLDIERLHNRGYSGREIAARLELAESTIRRDLDTISQRYRETTLVERTEGVNRMLVALRDTRREAWEAWERSKENKERQVKEKIAESLDGQGNPTPDTLQRMKAVVTSEGRLPGSEYLSIILRTYEEEAELLGLYADKTLRHAGPKGGPVEVSLEMVLIARKKAEEYRRECGAPPASG